MTPREYVLAAIQHRQTDRVPYILGFEEDVGKALDAHYGSAEWRKKVRPCLRFVGGVDSVAETRIDPAHVRDAFGAVWRTDRRPFHLEKPALSEPRVDAIDWPTADAFPLNVEKDLSELVGPGAEKFSILGNGWGIFEHSWRIRGFEDMLTDCVLNEDFYEELLDKLTELRLGMVAKFRDIPADAIMFGDDWGDQRGVLIGPQRWRKFLKPRWAKVYQAVHDQGKYAISHCCGSVADILPDIIEIGLDVLESCQPEAAGMNPFGLKKKYGDKITFWGCLGSQSTIQFASPDDIHRHVDRLCREMGRGGGFILAPAKDLQPGTPVDNAAAVVEAFARQNLPS